MMAKLLNKTKNTIIVAEIRQATGFLARLVGLIGKRSLNNSGLWIPSCNSVHTCFMRFPIDLIFVDENLNVVQTKNDVRPWRLVLPVKDADSVFELPAGTLDQNNLAIGDSLHVDENFNR